MKKFKIKRKDEVIVISGKHKGAIGQVVAVLSDSDQVIVQNVNKVTKHIKATTDAPGQKVQKEAPIHISNVALYDSESKSSFKVGYRDENGKKVRFNKSTGKTLES